MAKRLIIDSCDECCHHYAAKWSNPLRYRRMCLHPKVAGRYPNGDIMGRDFQSNEETKEGIPPTWCPLSEEPKEPSGGKQVAHSVAPE